MTDETAATWNDTAQRWDRGPMNWATITPPQINEDPPSVPAYAKAHVGASDSTRLAHALAAIDIGKKIDVIQNETIAALRADKAELLAALKRVVAWQFNPRAVQKLWFNCCRYTQEHEDARALIAKNESR